MKLYSPFAVLSLCAPAILASSMAAQAAEPQLFIKLTPVVEHGQAVALDVTEVYQLDGTLPPLTIAQTLGPLQHIDQRIHSIKVSDAAGAVMLEPTTTDIPDTLGKLPRAWKTNRATKGAVTVSYRADISRETTPGPTWELRSEPRGISAAGNTFLLLPQVTQPYQVKLSWDLTALGQGASAIDSLPFDGVALPQRIAATYYMAGQLHRYPANGDTKGPFRAASTADSNQFTQETLLTWAHDAYVKYSDFFGFPELPPFTVTFRSNPMISKSGTELPDALMVAANNDISLKEMTQILSHEMVHVYLHGLEGASWFQEGLAVMYENRAPYALGLTDSATYLQAVNNTLLTYYSNVRKDMDMQAATAAFWTDARARLQPYFRGALYFIVTDSRIRQASAGKHNLDQLLVDFLAQERAGKAVTAADWVALVRRYIGDAADSDYAAMQNGGFLVPEPEAFGRCFTREQVTMPLFELGFDISSLMQTPRVIHGLDPNSPAAKAGIREGDKVLKSVGLDEQQSKPSSPLTLLVERNGVPTPIAFVPTGKLTKGYQWRLKTDVSGKEAQCRE